MELAQGVFAFPRTADGGDMELTPGAVETARGVALIDLGLPGDVQAIGDALAGAGYGWDDVHLILLTHHDGDHAGALADVVDRTGATVAAHGAEVPYVEGDREPLKGAPYPPAAVDVELRDGVAVRTAAGRLRAVETPGHSPGHLAFHLPREDLLFAGDAVTAPDGTVSGPMAGATPDMTAASRSVARLAELAVERTVAYHGGVCEAGSAELRAVAETL